MSIAVRTIKLSACTACLLAQKAHPSPICAPPKCHTLPTGYSLERYHPAVLVLCGSFNPPTFMHLRMLELAQQALAKVGMK